MSATDVCVHAGWTDRGRVLEIVARYGVADAPQSSSFPDLDYYRFDHLPHDIVEKVVSVMPETVWDDRQNNGPPLRYFIETIRAHPRDVMLGGYLIGAGRTDERVTFDSIMMAEELADPECGHIPTVPEEAYLERWQSRRWIRLWWD